MYKALMNLDFHPETEEDESFKEVKTTVDNIINSGRLDADYDSDSQNLL